jgi:hypothetical protein
LGESYPSPHSSLRSISTKVAASQAAVPSAETQSGYASTCPAQVHQHHRGSCSAQAAQGLRQHKRRVVHRGEYRGQRVEGVCDCARREKGERSSSALGIGFGRRRAGRLFIQPRSTGQSRRDPAGPCSTCIFWDKFVSLGSARPRRAGDRCSGVSLLSNIPLGDGRAAFKLSMLTPCFLAC